MNEYFDLLKEWCDRLLSLQVTEFQEKEITAALCAHPAEEYTEGVPMPSIP